MDIKAFIASGILEHYLLGLATPEEASTVEQYAQQYPEVRQELDAIESALADFAQAEAVSMPEGLSDKILSKIDEVATGQPGATPPAVKPVGRGVLLGLALLALALLVLLFIFFNRERATQQELQQTQGQLQQLQLDCNDKDSQINDLQAQLQIMRTPGNQQIFMLGTDNAPNAIASVHYNPQSQTAFLDVISLDTPPTGKQYQLWAIVDGQPVDMGVFNIPIQVGTFQTVPFIENAQAFAVTVENQGGSPTPSLETMVVVGNVG